MCQKERKENDVYGLHSSNLACIIKPKCNPPLLTIREIFTNTRIPKDLDDMLTPILRTHFSAHIIRWHMVFNSPHRDFFHHLIHLSTFYAIYGHMWKQTEIR